MNTSPESVRFDDDTLWVGLADGCTIAAPLTWFPRLLEATPEQRAQVELSKSGLHRDALDEDILVAGLSPDNPICHGEAQLRPHRTRSQIASRWRNGWNSLTGAISGAR